MLLVVLKIHLPKEICLACEQALLFQFGIRAMSRCRCPRKRILLQLENSQVLIASQAEIKTIPFITQNRSKILRVTEDNWIRCINRDMAGNSVKFICQ